MREILFRAKRIDNGNWVEGDLRQDRDLETAYISGWDYYTIEGGLEREPFEYEIEPETLCQYTGLKDKNGNRIWENDILQNARNNDLYTVKWHGSFGMYVWSKRKENNKHIFDYGDLYLMNRKCVVISNIFDDPEPLKGE